MKRKLILFGISLLLMIGAIIPSSSAQDFQLTPTQLKQTNILLNRLEELEIQDSLNQQLIIYYDSIVKEYQWIKLMDDEAMKVMHDDLDNMLNTNKELEENNSKLRKQRNGLTYYAGGSTLLCIVLLIIAL